WIRDMASGQARQVTHLTTQPQGASFSPDGKRLVFFDVSGMWRVANMSIHDTLAQPGTPTWSPDGTRIALAEVAPFSRRFREGTNQVLTIAATPGPLPAAEGGGPERVAPMMASDKWFAPEPMMSIDSRGNCGPVWSPDGTKMAAIYEGTLAVWPVASSGEPLGPPRHVTSE